MYRKTGICLFLITIFALSGVCHAQEIQWQNDLDDAKQMATSQGKMILLHFSAEWCRPCKNLEKFVFTSQRVSKAVHDAVVPVHVDTDLHPELVKQFAVSEIPCDVVITTKGRVITKRKSPKTADDYVRMIDSLPASETATKQQNLELTQKIDQVISASNQKVVQKNNDFRPSSMASAGPKVNEEGLKLAAKSKTQLVSHQQSSDDSEAEPAGGDAKDVTFNRSQRVINDTFFVEKSVQAQAGKETVNDSAERGEQNTDANSFQSKSSNVASSTDNNAARILTPDFGRRVDQNQFSQPTSSSKSVASLSAAPAQSDLMSKSTAKLVANDSAKQFLPTKADTPNLAAVKAGAANDKSGSPNTASKDAGDIQPEYALAGKCPVTLIKEKRWVDGDKQFGCLHRGRLYLFVDKVAMQQFRQDPEMYSPMLAGYDPVLFHEDGALVDGMAKHGVFMGKAPSQKIVLFSSQESRSKFQKEPRKFMNTIRMAVEQSDRNMK